MPVSVCRIVRRNNDNLHTYIYPFQLNVMAKEPTHINDVCHKHPTLKKITQHAQLLERLNHAFQQSLPAQFSAHCKLANISGTTLILHTDNAAYSSLIRFQAPVLCKKLSQDLSLDINTIEVKVRPNQPLFENQSSNSIALPASASTALKQTADTMEDGPLKAALERLALRKKS